MVYLQLCMQLSVSLLIKRRSSSLRNVSYVIMHFVPWTSLTPSPFLSMSHQVGEKAHCG